ncbi:MAG: hypothetical protein ACM31D_03485 [Bacteroidota bacterium]
MSSGSILSSVYSSSLFQSTLERTQLIVKQSMAKRMEADVAALNDKYDGKKAAALEDQINGIADQKFDVSNYLTNVQTGLKRMDALRTELLSAKDAIAKGSVDAFNLHINTINTWIGKQSDDPDSLIANNTDGKGNWRKDVAVVSGGGQSVNLEHQFMGTDYAIVLDDGNVLRPNAKTSLLSANGTGATLSHLATLTAGDGSTISGTIVTANGQTTITDGSGNTYTGTDKQVTDSLGNTYSVATSDKVTVNYADGSSQTGTLKRGGLGVLHGWAYGDFNSSDPTAKAAAQQAANADIDAAMRKLAQMERTLNLDEAGLSGITQSLDGKSSALADEYKKVSEEELTAKQAERRAIETRFNISTNAMALSNQTTSTMIYQMFNNPWSTDKKSLSDVLLGAAGY